LGSVIWRRRDGRQAAASPPDQAAISIPRRLVDREAFILEHCRARRVLDVGFIDHPFLEQRLADGSWLHAKIVGVAREVVGVDSAAQQVDDLRGRPDIGQVLIGDAEQLDALALDPFEVIVAGETLEHLNNPGLFLASARRLLVPGGRLLVSVPNAFCVRRLVRVPTGIEKVHPDHVAYYSHATLGALLRRFDYVVETAATDRLPQSTPRTAYLLDALASLVSPNLCEGLVYSALPRSP